MSKIVPLFPLPLVVYPSAKYMLHIFEERYKKMIAFVRTLDQEFGIIPVKDSEPARIGSLVKVIRILKTNEDGSFDIMIEGTRRFVLRSILQHEDGYFMGEADGYEDIGSAAYTDLEDEARHKFEEIVKKAEIKLEDEFWDNLNSAKLKSYKLAEKSGLTLKQQQDLLILQSEGERLFFLIEHLDYINGFLDNREVVRQIVLNDGYINKDTFKQDREEEE